MRKRAVTRHRIWQTGLVVLLACNAVAAAEAWFTADAAGRAVVRPATTPAEPLVTVTHSDADGLTVVATTAGVLLRAHDEVAGSFTNATWPAAAVAGEHGAPAIPVIRRAFLAPPGARVTVRTDVTPAVLLDLAAAGWPTWLAPVQPPIEKLPGAREAAPFVLDAAAYAADAWAPAELATVTEVGTVRGQSLWLLEIRPLAYNPVAGVLALQPDIVVDLEFAGGTAPRADLAPLPGLDRVVLNSELLPAIGRDETGNYLIVVAPALEQTVQMLAAAKATQGHTVSVWPATTASGPTIKAHIQGLWNTPDAPDYVLLVGDTDTIPAWVGGGDGTPSTDLPYVCMDGPYDWLPDIAVGRLPARSTTELQAIIDKTLHYELSPLPDPNYLNRAVFMASNDNYTVSEGTHNWVINNYMVPSAVLYDRLYCHTYHATTQHVRNAFNAGRFWGIYSGHGSETSWADGPPFSQSDVNNLTNAGMYPFVYSFACVTGSYTLGECFMETWIRAAGKGAVVAVGSSVNSYWTEDDVLEKRLFDAIYDTTDPVAAQTGPVWNETLYRYLVQMGSHQTTRRYFEMYNLMGDPALPYFRPDLPVQGLRVSPADDFAAVGAAGGPFAPASIDYTLENVGDDAIGYEVSAPAEWLTITNGVGTLPPHSTTVVTVALNSAAEQLPEGRHDGLLTFTNTTGFVGNTSRNAILRVGTPFQAYAWDFDTDPNWAVQGLWAWGEPVGGGGEVGCPDPTGGYTGNNVYGYNLAGDYENNLAETHLTSAAIDCSQLSDVTLRFRRWLGVGHAAYDQASVRVSLDGFTWTTVWGNGAEFSDGAWVLHELDLSAVADGKQRVFLRWTMGVTDATGRHCGWNIDDVELWALPAPPPRGACCHADGTCTMTLEGGCTGSWLGAWADCAANPCPPPSGACCRPDGSCYVTQQTSCRETWMGAGVGCGPNPCPQPTGACCDYYGVCMVRTQAQCAQAGGTYLGSLTTCNPNPCPAPPVCPGDANCDTLRTWRDIDYFVAAMNDNVAAWQALFGTDVPVCPFANNDANGDGTVNWRDIDALVSLMNTACP